MRLVSLEGRPGRRPLRAVSMIEPLFEQPPSSGRCSTGGHAPST
jgi:hypothetical protein